MIEGPLGICIDKTYKEMAYCRYQKEKKALIERFQIQPKTRIEKEGQCFNCRNKFSVLFIAWWTSNKFKYCNDCYDRALQKFFKRLEKMKNNFDLELAKKKQGGLRV